MGAWGMRIRKGVHDKTSTPAEWTSIGRCYDTKPSWMAIQVSHHTTPRSTIYCVTQWKGHTISRPAESHSDPMFPHGTLVWLARPDATPSFFTSSFYHLHSTTMKMRNRQTFERSCECTNSAYFFFSPLSLLSIIKTFRRFFNVIINRERGLL